MDLQRFFQKSDSAIASAERDSFTGRIEARVYYRNGKAKRGFVRKLSCKVLNRDPLDVIESPARSFQKLEAQLTWDGGQNEDAEIGIFLVFFQGTAVDRHCEILQHQS